MMAPDDPRHGSLEGYNRGRCRAVCCRLVYSRWRKRRDHDAANGRPRIVDATGTRRRLQALYAAGWTWRAITARYGTTEGTARNHARGPTCTATTARKVAALYTELADLEPAAGTPAELRARNAARRRAREAGWVPPIAWDDDTLDDPTAKPYAGERVTVDWVTVERLLAGHQERANRAERLEVARRWQRSGGSLRDLDTRYGWNLGRDLRETRTAAA